MPCSPIGHTVVAGDMDSARSEVLDFYRSHGAEVRSLAEDQDTTDLGKCLAYLTECFSADELHRLTIVVLGAMQTTNAHDLSLIHQNRNWMGLQFYAGVIHYSM